MSILPKVSDESAVTIDSGEIKITPRVIDFGHRIIQMGQVSRVDLGLIYPYRSAAMFLALFAILALWQGLTDYGQSAVVKGLIGAGLLFLTALSWRYFIEFLLITTSDGRRLQISAERKFLLEILDKIRDAMQFEEDRDVRYTVNMSAGNIEVGSNVDQSSASVVNSPGGQATVGDIGVPTRQDGTRPNGAMPNGAGTPQEPTSAYVPSASAPALLSNGARIATVHGSLGGIAIAGDVGSSARVQSTITISEQINADLSQLMILIERHNIEYREAMIEHLRIIQQQVAAGPSQRVAAAASWKTFADYAMQNLGRIDGVIGLVERIARLMQ